VNFAGDGRQAWLDGLGVGTVVANSASGVSVAHNTATALTNVVLAAGTWVIQGNVGFASNTMGTRTVDISATSASVAGSILAETGVQVAASSSG
jgi:hypothetical protein